METQHQLTHHPVKISILPLKKMPIFQSFAPRDFNFIFSGVIISLWDLASAHSPSRRELNPSFQEDVRFSGHSTSVY